MVQAVPDSPEQIARLLAELEAEKAALQNRLNSLDSVIAGIQTLIETPPSATHDDSGSLDGERGFVLVRETEPVEPPQQLEHSRDEVAKRDQVASSDKPRDNSRSLIEREKSLGRPLPKPPSERPPTAKLNIYVNQHADWAARQLVSNRSSRSSHRRKTGYRCPSCGSSDTRVSLTRGVSDLFMFLFDYTSARCRNCDTRFRIWRTHPEDDEPPTELVEPETTK